MGATPTIRQFPLGPKLEPNGETNEDSLASDPPQFPEKCSDRLQFVFGMGATPPVVHQSDLDPKPEPGEEKDEDSFASDGTWFPEHYPRRPQSAFGYPLPPLPCPRPAPNPALAFLCPKGAPPPANVGEHVIFLLVRHPGLSIYMNLFPQFGPVELYRWIKSYALNPDLDYAYRRTLASVFFRGLHEPEVARLLLTASRCKSTAQQDDRLKAVIEEQKEKRARGDGEEMRVARAWERHMSFIGAYNELYGTRANGEES
ncbi:uncharacterized protein BDZ99DRAFT_260394 [Mytilinidion resinicola]|uniref:Uncharacterized protein n=1 Tax=Mytilinidion resinicola TaxID=574789 RepID=A0A6A6YVP5_9PEZI|nr:uncharacterized protein BDZ99DRAFT_260394 [Mytilinidion resinicola]KAF2812064.1 hypothetical protein BDZ99DRAFT_260394 [Mytilinidion resinicola]